MEWIQSNWVNILAIVGGLDALFYAITKITKSEKDDNLYAIVHGWIVKLFPKK